MATYDLKDFDVYSYTINLRPNVLNASGAGALVAAHFEPYYFSIPNNFFVFPNQKCYFELVGILLTGETTPPASNTVYLAMDMPSRYQYSNLNSNVAATLANPMVDHPQSAMVSWDMDTDGTMIKLRSNLVCIPPPFGSRVQFSIKVPHLVHGTLTMNGPILYNTTLEEFLPKAMAHLVFNILVPKNKEEKYDASHTRL